MKWAHTCTLAISLCTGVGIKVLYTRKTVVQILKGYVDERRKKDGVFFWSPRF